MQHQRFSLSSLTALAASPWAKGVKRTLSIDLQTL